MIRPTTSSFLIAALAVTSFATVYIPQSAEARPSTRSYTCKGVRNYIARHGAVVMNTKNSSVYRRFVANRSLCYPSQVLGRYTAPTKSGRCTLYYCKEYDCDGFGGFNCF